MNYGINLELARTLKDKGFPQKHFGQGSWIVDGVFIPTTDELIDAIGEDFEGIRKVFDESDQFKYWFAECTNKKGVCCEGKTPGEALANLWLALKSY